MAAGDVRGVGQGQIALNFGAEPLRLTGWTITDAYGYGPALWVAPVLHDGAREREVPLPRGEWIETWSGRRASGGGEVVDHSSERPFQGSPVRSRCWSRRGCGSR